MDSSKTKSCSLLNQTPTCYLYLKMNDLHKTAVDGIN